MEAIRRGILKFQREIYPARRREFEDLADNQEPHTLFITCSDSRVVPELLTQSRPGEIFICRTAGNMVPTYGETHGGVSATIEYAIAVLHVRDIVICGHTDCGAMRGILKPANVANLPAVRRWLHHGEAARVVVEEAYPELPEDLKLQVLTRENIVAQLENLRTHPPVAARMRSGRLQVHGLVYDIQRGHVDVFDSERGFVPIKEYSPRPASSVRSHMPVAVGAD